MASGAAGIAALTVLPTNRLLHSLATDEVVQVHIDLKRCEAQKGRGAHKGDVLVTVARAVRGRRV
jgi:hypothetical protein